MEDQYSSSQQYTWREELDNFKQSLPDMIKIFGICFTVWGAFELIAWILS